jgi:polysaccharide biosynthesis protein PslG
MVNLVALLGAVASLLNPQAQSGAGLEVGFTNTTQKPPAVVPPQQAAALEEAIAPGGLMRFSIQWRVAQPDEGGPIDLDTVDRQLVQPALSHGLRPLVVLIAAPEWAWGSGECDRGVTYGKGFCTMPPGDDPENLEHWREFVAAVANRWRGKLAGIEIWNEENGAGFWSEVGGPDPAQYADVLCTAYDAVRSVDPSTPVIMGGLAASFATDARHISAPEYLAQLYEDPDHKLTDCTSALTVHAYPVQHPADASDSPFLRKLTEIRAVRDAHDDGARHIWITEFGYWTGGSDGVSLTEQAAGLSCGVRLAAAMPDVDALVIHDLVDRGPPYSTEGSFGVFAEPIPGAVVAKPAAFALDSLLGRSGGIPPPPC